MSKIGHSLDLAKGIILDALLILKALILGVVEGLTEFLPISSTGHLIIVGDLLNFNDERGKIFEIVIQFGAILAVCWLFRLRLWQAISGLKRSTSARRFSCNIVVASLPAIVMALLFGSLIKRVLFNPLSVAIALIVGGFIILWIERRYAKNSLQHRVGDIDQISTIDAFKIGCLQCLALLPGTSRSGATIMGGILCGLSRQVATEFSFFLAIPILFGATVYELFKARHLLQMDDVYLIAIGFLAAFFSALVCVRWLLRFIVSHTFCGFAWYRIGFGVFILLTAGTGAVQWG